MPRLHLLAALTLLLSAALTPLYAGAAVPDNSLLEQYINADDGVFAYQQVATIPQQGLTVYVYRLTSQKWRSQSEVDRPLWTHRVTLVVPDNLTTDKAILFTFGDENTDDFLTPDPGNIELLGQFALASGSIAAQVSQVPNQPLVFADEPATARVEDDLVAYSWDTAMGTGDYTWAAYLPMTKSVVRAMDAVQGAADDLSLSPTPEKFVLAGFSKRGAITWLAAAIDDRVAAISPGVFDTLNFTPSTENQRRIYGEFPEPLAAYEMRNVLDRLRTAEGRELIRVVDPYEYRHHVDIPKYILNASGDQFYPPDSSLFYINNLAGESRLRYLPNTNHGGANGGFENAMSGLLAWYQRIVSGTPRPTVDWHREGAQLSVTVNDANASAQLWSAHNPEARDFRLATFGPNWQATPLSIGPDGGLTTELTVPDTGWSGYFVEITFPGVGGIPEQYTTPVFVLPDTRPFDLTQPRFEPQPKAIWREKLNAIVNGDAGNPALADTFPIRAVGDQTIADIDAAYALLDQPHPDKRTRAQQTCLVSRLNIKDGQFDWYSTPTDTDSIFSWQLWNLADALYRLNLYQLSTWACHWLNK